MQPRGKTSYHIPKELKAETAAGLRPLIRWFDAYKGTCLFVTDQDGGFCGQDASRRHTIPNARVLSRLVDENDEVLELQWGVGNMMHLFLQSNPRRTIDLFDPATFEPIRVGRRVASVGKFACGEHDVMFDDIDYAEPDSEDPNVKFLLTYRVSLYITDLLKQAALLVGNPEPHKRNMRSSETIRIEWLKSRERINVELPRARFRSDRLGKIWFAKENEVNIDPNLVSGQLLYFRSRLKFAASLLYGEDLTITVTPLDNDHHRMAITHLTEVSDSVAADVQQLAESAENSRENSEYGLTAFVGLALRSSGRVAVSPESYRALDHDNKLKVNEIVQLSSGGSSLANTIESGLRHNRRRGQKRGRRPGARRKR